MHKRRPRNTLRRNLSMSRLSLALVAVATITAACYQDDARIAPNSAGPSAKVLLTDDPFPFDSVQSVQVYIVSIALSTHPDTGTSADSMQWVTVAALHRQVDLLTAHSTSSRRSVRSIEGQPAISQALSRTIPARDP